MKKVKFLLSVAILGLLCALSVHRAYSYEDLQEVENNGSIFYLVSLNQSETIILNCSSENQLNYSLFLFNTRPSSSNKYLNGTYSTKIYDLAIVVSEGFEPQLTYTANETQLYYIQIIVYNKSTNLIRVYSNKEIGRYYLPLINSFPLEFFGTITTITIIAITVILLKKRKLKLDN